MSPSPILEVFDQDSQGIRTAPRPVDATGNHESVPGGKTIVFMQTGARNADQMPEVRLLPLVRADHNRVDPVREQELSGHSR